MFFLAETVTESNAGDHEDALDVVVQGGEYLVYKICNNNLAPFIVFKFGQ